MTQQTKLQTVGFVILLFSIGFSVIKYCSPKTVESEVIESLPLKKVGTTRDGDPGPSPSRLRVLETHSGAHPNKDDMSDLERIRRIRDSKPVPKFAMFDETGTLSNQLIDLYNIDDGNAVQIQKALSDFLSSARQLFLSRVEVDALRSRPAEGIRAYRCLPFESEMTPIFGDLARKVERQVGTEFADQILSTFPVDSFYSSMGRKVTSIKVIEDTTGTFGGKVKFEVELRDEQTGILKTKATMTETLLNRYFPGFFHDGEVKINQSPSNAN